jgi:hypothetical protein
VSAQFKFCGCGGGARYVQFQAKKVEVPVSENETTWAWLWDVDMDRSVFRDILHARTTVGSFDAKWALSRLIEYAPYREIINLLPRQIFLRLWPDVSEKIRSPSRREGMDYVYQRLISGRAA